MKIFDKNDKKLRAQFDEIAWIEESGFNEEQLRCAYEEIAKQNADKSHAILKAKLFALLCEKSRYALDLNDVFQNKLFAGGFIAAQRGEWIQETVQAYLAKETQEKNLAFQCGAYKIGADFGHTSPNSKLLLEIGFGGLLKRIETAEKRENLTPEQLEFYQSCKIVLSACTTFILRLADGIAPYDTVSEKCLRQIASNAPTNTYEAMQLLIAYFFLHDYTFRTRVRTLGRLDVLLYPFYKRDIQSGSFTKSEIKELLKFFLNKFSAAKVPFDLPFCLGGIDEDGNETTNELSFLIVETYQELNIYSPKIHIRVSDKTPEAFIKLVLNSIRSGNNSFVFCNDAVAIPALMKVGIEERDAKNYLPIGCYEPAVWGKEIGCTGNGAINLAKAIEFAFSGGVDVQSGARIGARTSANETDFKTFEQFYGTVKTQIAYMIEKCLQYVRKIERFYHVIGPDPFHSAMYDTSVERGLDVYSGGAKYNNSSLFFYAIATLVDSLTAVKKFVYDEKRLTLSEFFDILKNDWKGAEKLRLLVQRLPEKYGNENPLADELTKDITDFCASLTNNQPNARGGVFKASLFSIDYCFEAGKKTMATPDGRFKGETVSKNLCASYGMDKNGVLALIHSASVIDYTQFSNGSVLDVVLHPTAVQGEDGLNAFYAILKTYFDKGGFAMHGNVFSAENLKKAQKQPEKYATLQVRVCGWNAYFVSLTQEEQNAFIVQAENAEATKNFAGT